MLVVGAALIQGGPGLVGTGHVWSGLENLHAAMFVSADGMSWDRIDDPWMEEGPNTNMVDVASGPGGTLVAAGGDGSDAGIWVSEDGLSWSQVTSDVLGGADVQAILGVVAGWPGFVAVGDDGSHAGVWVSPDGY